MKKLTKAEEIFKDDLYGMELVARVKVLAAQLPFKISNLRLTMSRRFGIIESF